MTRAHFVKKARKDNDVVKKGESYWWWKFRRGGKYMSARQPKPSQLTQSDFLSQQLSLAEELDDLGARFAGEDSDESRSEFEGDRDDIASRIKDLGEDQTNKRDNMPEQLQDCETGELLQNRADSCEAWSDEVEAWDYDDRADGTPEYEGE